MRAGLRHRLRAERAKKTFQLKLTQSHVVYRRGNWYMRFAGSWFRITEIGLAPNRNDLELCKDENGLITPHVVGKPEPRNAVSRYKMEGDLFWLNLENGIGCYWDLSVLEGDAKRMILAMLSQTNPRTASREGMAVEDWIRKLEREVTV